MDGFIVFGAKYMFALSLLVCGIVFLAVRGAERRLLFLRGLVVGGVSIALSLLSSLLYYEPRPFVAHHFTPLINHVADSGFPSDHALLCCDCAIGIFSFSRGASAFLAVVAVVVGWARVASGLHSPFDILAGAGFACVANGASWLLIRRKSDSAAESKNLREDETK